MKKQKNFLRSEAYRRTFLIYLCIVLLFTVTILGFVYRDMYKTAQENFIGESAEICGEVDRRAGQVVRGIDRFYAQLYADPDLSEDFFRFFGSTAEEYTSRRLSMPAVPKASVLDNFKSLVIDSGYSIRHIIFYSRENVADLEFNARGDSRHRIITTEEADEICRTGCVYQKDIHRASAYLGKISIVVDLTGFAAQSMEQTENRGMCMIMPDRIASMGSVQISDEQAASLLEQGGFPKKIAGAQGGMYCMLRTSQHLPYAMVYLVQARVLLQNLYSKFALLTACILAAFGAITAVLIWRFSRDLQYITSILDSMGKAEKGNFTPIPVTGHNPDYDEIIRGLNKLYANLDSMIKREYKLTISQQKAQMDMLSAQLSPHFLYNTLERIRMRAVAEDARDVAEATAGLGLLYRNIVKTEAVIPMKRELEITRQYLDLMTFLYGDQFMYFFDVDEELEEIPTPKIWMQPIVENFFKHNFQQDDQIKVIIVELRTRKNGFEGHFFDNIGHMEPERVEELNEALANDSTEGQGIGLYNVLHRLRLYYGGSLKMKIENNDPAGIGIRILYEKEETQNVPASDRG